MSLGNGPTAGSVRSKRAAVGISPSASLAPSSSRAVVRANTHAIEITTKQPTDRLIRVAFMNFSSGLRAGRWPQADPNAPSSAMVVSLVLNTFMLASFSFLLAVSCGVLRNSRFVRGKIDWIRQQRINSGQDRFNRSEPVSQIFVDTGAHWVVGACGREHVQVMSYRVLQPGEGAIVKESRL